MQPTLCSRCKKNVAVIFITRIENGESHNEGLCLRCARELHIKPVDEMMEKLGISDADLDNLTEAYAADIKAAQDAAAAAAEPPHADGSAADKRGAAPRKLKFLNNYCIDLTQRARRQARRHGRPRRGARARHPDPQPPPEE